MKYEIVKLQVEASKERQQQEAEIEQKKMEIWQQNPPTFSEVNEYTKMRNEYKERMLQLERKQLIMKLNDYDMKQLEAAPRAIKLQRP